MTDIELFDKYCDTSEDYVNPFAFCEIIRRGFYPLIVDLPKDSGQAKAVIRGRMGKTGRTVDDPADEGIDELVARLEQLRAELSLLNMADSHKVMPVLADMVSLTIRLADFYHSPI